MAGFFDWQCLVLPCLTLGAVGAGYYARLVHSNMLEVLNQDYVRAARARGLSEPVVLFKHALRNALIPVLTVLGLDVAALLAGVVFTESIFALPGLGALALQAVPGVLEVIPIGGELGLGSDMEQRPLDRAQVADSIVDDCYQPSRPLDDGTPPPPRTDIASRKARPSALNVPSAM